MASPYQTKKMNHKKHILPLFFLLLALGTVRAQSRKYISSFSHFQSYHNPGLTGYEGSTLRGFVRNQWSGIEGAPKTYFVSAELDFGELSGQRDPALTGKNAVSVNVLQETYGAFRETEFTFGYASRIRLSEKLNVRLGAGINYQSVRLDGNALSIEEQGDPTLGQYLGQFSNMNVVDFNLGIALTHANYYVSYGIHRVNGGRISSGDGFMDAYPASNVVQAGYRNAISDQVAVIVNAFYRGQKGLDDNFEFNVKALLLDRFWLGIGERVNHATSAQAGVVTRRLRLGYVYEFPTGGDYLLRGNTHEFTVVFSLFRDNVRTGSQPVFMW